MTLGKIICIGILFASLKSIAEDKNQFVDSRDGQVYKSVVVGNQIWMAENLNFRVQNSRCYDNDKTNCKKYGRLYKWKATANVCPAGWHVPSKTEFEILINAVGDTLTAGKKIKSKTGWINYNGKNGNGLNSFGFSAEPSGFWIDYKEYFTGKGDFAEFWSSTAIDEYNAFRMELDAKKETVNLNRFDNTVGLSVRCIKDNTNSLQKNVCFKTTMFSNDGFSETGNRYDGYYCGDTTSKDLFARASCKEGDLYFAGNKLATLEWGQGVEPFVICVPSNFKCPKGRFLAEYKYGKQIFYACVEPPNNAHFDSQLKRITCDNNFSNHEYRNCESEFCDDNSDDLMLKCIPKCSKDKYLDFMEEKCKAIPMGARKIDEYTWECDKKFSRYNNKDECRPWPKNAAPSKGCWFSSVNISDLSSKTNECPESIEIEGKKYYCYDPIDGGDDCTLTNCLEEIGRNLRAPLGTEVIFNFPKEKISVRMKQIFTQNESLGKWSGCWGCPKGTIFDMNKNECVPK